MSFIAFRMVSLAAAMLCAGQAAADWAYVADQGPSGQAVGAGASGTTLTVDCGDGDRPALFIEPPPLPPELAPDGAVVTVELDVDGEALAVPMICYEPGPCWIDPPADSVPTLVERLRRGLSLTLAHQHEAVETFSLRGSAAALAGMTRAGCSAL